MENLYFDLHNDLGFNSKKAMKDFISRSHLDINSFKSFNELKSFISNRKKTGKKNIVIVNKKTKQQPTIADSVKELPFSIDSFDFNELKKTIRAEKMKMNNKDRHFQKIVDEYNYHNVDKKESRIRDKQRLDRRALNGAFKETIFHDNFGFQLHQEKSKDQMISVIRHTLIDAFKNNRSYQLIVCINVAFSVYKIDEESGERMYDTFYYNSSIASALTSEAQIKSWVKQQVDRLENHIDLLVNGSSKWIFDEIEIVKVQLQRRKRIKGGSFIETPEVLKTKRALNNVKNTDHRCLLYCLASFMFREVIKTKMTTEPKTYQKYLKEIKEPEHVCYPIDVDTDLPLFEELNNIKINVWHYPENNYDETPKILYNGDNRNEKACDLLLLSDDEKSHFVLITNLNALMRSADEKTRKTTYWCSQCVNYSTEKKELYEEHVKNCLKKEIANIELPDEGKNTLKFKNYNNKFLHPFSVFMDFESTLQPITSEDLKQENEEKNIKFSEMSKEQQEEYLKSMKTIKYQHHIPNSCGLKFNCIHTEFSQPLKLFNNQSKDALMKSVIEEVEALAKESYRLTQVHKWLDRKLISEEDKAKHATLNACDHCQSTFTKENVKVLHHDHITGQYISTLCSNCNLFFQYQKFLPVYVHNLKGYDSHFIIESLAKYGDSTAEISCIPNNEERYISFSKIITVDHYIDKDKKSKPVKYEIRFLDSFAFMASSLEKLADNLRSGKNDIDYLRKAFRNTSEHFRNDEQFLLMIQKGIYPYEYITSYEKLLEQSLPKQEDFNSKFTNYKCPNNDYHQAQHVWNVFKCQSFLEYHNLYLSSDVLLLADIWESFRNVCFKIYSLDPCYYYTAPSLSWDAFLYHSKVQLELLTNMEMYEFIENGIRGGLCQASLRYGKANNQYMEDYDSSKPDEYIMYYDANNLYGWAMCQRLPKSKFMWNRDQWTAEKVLEVHDEGDIGYTFEVDIEYPEELHDLHNGYALGASNMVVKNDYLNDWQRKDREEPTVKKLCTSFLKKEKYIVHYRLLKIFIQQGLKITGFHRVLQYEQSDFMKSYIMKNTNERKKAKNDFEKDFFKLMNNSCFGKTMENVRNRIDFVLLSSEEKALKMRNAIKGFTIFNENLVGVHRLHRTVRLNKPIYIGLSVLDDSKHLMYNFHYNFMLKQFKRENVNVMYTDTDSLVYHIKNEDPYEMMKNNKHMFDLSDYPEDHELYDTTNKKVMGKFKDETNGTPITEFIALRAKMYSFVVGRKTKMKCKGVKNHVVKNQFTNDVYKHVLETKEKVDVKQCSFRSYKHQLYTEEVKKVGLSANDDKAYIIDGVKTYTLGHKNYYNK